MTSPTSLDIPSTYCSWSEVLIFLSVGGVFSVYIKCVFNFIGHFPVGSKHGVGNVNHGLCIGALVYQCTGATGPSAEAQFFTDMVGRDTFLLSENHYDVRHSWPSDLRVSN